MNTATEVASTGHLPELQDHFASAAQQKSAAKLGMWIFLSTEILLFGGLFCAYAVYRSNHPEIFLYAHRFLDKTLGAINTAVLITSSVTVVLSWASLKMGQFEQDRHRSSMRAGMRVFAGVQIF